LKLSELISYTNTVNQISLSKSEKLLNAELKQLQLDINLLDINELSQYKDDVVESIMQLVSSTISANHALKVLQQKSVEFVRKEEQQSMIRSDEIYQLNRSMIPKDRCKMILDQYANLPLFKDTSIKDDYRASIVKYSSWKHPAAFIRPLLGEYIDEMLPFDPLYILDDEFDLVRPVKKLYNANYQARLRYNIIKEDCEEFVTNILPHNQLGFILVNEFFYRRPLNIIRKYLEEFLVVLKPGGVVMFTYNNCDLVGAVENFEAGLYCYTPASLVVPLVEMLGYEIVNKYDHESNVSWLEIKKPGTLTSLKGGQCLGEIINVND